LKEKESLRVGLDIGSTTVKIAVLDPVSDDLLHSRYIRHNADQTGAVRQLLYEAHDLFPVRGFRVVCCGSGGQAIAEGLGAFFLQEVVANSLAVRSFHDDVSVAIELGGQDAKVIFFRRDESTGKLMAGDMRMNGSCAGGTGAFIDQIAELLNVKPEEFNALAARGTRVHTISGRCGVFAKTDIQPLLNQGVSRSDIALSSFHAIAKQTIGGLAQGMTISPKVIFEGGPLTFNPVLVRVFKERLGLTDSDVVTAAHPEIIVAIGAAVSASVMYGSEPGRYQGAASLTRSLRRDAAEDAAPPPLFFTSPAEKEEFLARTALPVFVPPEFPAGSMVNAWLGIDAGSTTSKFVLLDDDTRVIHAFYASNRGDPLGVLVQGLKELRQRFADRGVNLVIKGAGSTGYGEKLVGAAFHADYGTVETVAHAAAARQLAPGAGFILDIGGQDMKAITLRGEVVTGIILNEACSAGCGSFLETYARSLGVPVGDVAARAFAAENPSELGSRCTVFMNSSIITEQKNGRSTDDILAGLCRSIIENVFTKVIRLSGIQALKGEIVVQGGTFKNDVVLRAMEQYAGQKVVRPPFPGEMGAIGIALLTKQEMEKRAGTGPAVSSFIGLEALDGFAYTSQEGQVCPWCANSCSRTLLEFGDGGRYVTGNRCERGEVFGDGSDPATREKLRKAGRRRDGTPDHIRLQNELLFGEYPAVNPLPPRHLKIGLPRVLEFWHSMPFWRSVFEHLGFEAVISDRSSYNQFESGIGSIPSDTVCFPAKLAHGHIRSLADKKVDRIFMPMFSKSVRENAGADDENFCLVVQGYPLVVREADEPERKYGIPFDTPHFSWGSETLKLRQLKRYFRDTFGIPGKAVAAAVVQGNRALADYKQKMLEAGGAVLDAIGKPGEFAVVIAGRPYHGDELVNHKVAAHFTALGVPVMTLDTLPGLETVDLSHVRSENIINFHTRMVAAATVVSRDSRLELVQLVSFGCGHDAVLTDEMVRIMQEGSGREMLVLKLDEGENTGPLSIRIRSFVETIRSRRLREAERGIPDPFTGFPKPFEKTFDTGDKDKRTILIPVLSPAFTRLTACVLEEAGYKALPLPVADREAINLGKRFVHNDICYPAQVNVGEALLALTKGGLNQDEVALGLAKNCESCRAGQYAAIARKALDEAGFDRVPIITTGRDTKGIHPGFRLDLAFQIKLLWGITLMDGLEMMLRRVRPYELAAGESDRVFAFWSDRIFRAVPRDQRLALKLFAEAVEAFNGIPCERTNRRPRVGIIGEILLNFHPASNNYLENYLEKNGMEIVMPTMHDFFRSDNVIRQARGKQGLVHNAFIARCLADVKDAVYGHVHGRVAAALKGFKFDEGYSDVWDLASQVTGLMDLAYKGGEGWLIPGEISHLVKKGVSSFVIVQPFGCLPNHITGRGLFKTLKKRFPRIQLVALDYDPDISPANIENRLQMLIISAREMHGVAAAGIEPRTENRDEGQSLDPQGRRVPV
jgi:predicted CoA-substrate-specific enzyme activase